MGSTDTHHLRVSRVRIFTGAFHRDSLIPFAERSALTARLDRHVLVLFLLSSQRPENILLRKRDMILEDARTIEELQVKNDDIILLSLLNEGKEREGDTMNPCIDSCHCFLFVDLGVPS